MTFCKLVRRTTLSRAQGRSPLTSFNINDYFPSCCFSASPLPAVSRAVTSPNYPPKLTEFWPRMRLGRLTVYETMCMAHIGSSACYPDLVVSIGNPLREEARGSDRSIQVAPCLLSESTLCKWEGQRLVRNYPDGFWSTDGVAFLRFSVLLWQRSVTRVGLSLIHIWRCRRAVTCRSRWSPYH